MRTLENRTEYGRLSSLLQQICIRYKRDLPPGTTSVCLTNDECRIRLTTYDKNGEPTGIIPDERTSVAFVNELALAFGSMTSPEPKDIIAAVEPSHEQPKEQRSKVQCLANKK
jgi:hypothetical protein